jgi:predicted Zn-dependent protease with MMP-like domain
MDREGFEKVAQEVFDSLPPPFLGAIDNVHIVVEDRPSRETGARVGYRPGTLLLGLYEGIPLTKRGSSYGMYGVVPDKITLYRENIRAVAPADEEMRRVIRDTLIHEIGHYFGMNERQIRAAGY